MGSNTIAQLHRRERRNREREKGMCVHNKQQVSLLHVGTHCGLMRKQGGSSGVTMTYGMAGQNGKSCELLFARRSIRAQRVFGML